MNHLKLAVFLSGLIALSACGRQVVEFELDDHALDAGRSDDAGPKPLAEAGADAALRPDAAVPDAGSGVAPVVRSTVPVHAATSVAPNDALLATFSKPMDPATITSQTFVVQQGTTPVSGTVSLNGSNDTAMFMPASMLSPNQTYTATITTGARDTEGLSLVVSYTWMFTTAGVPTAPRVASATPLNGVSDAAIITRPTATFASAMDAATITSATFLVQQGGAPVDGQVTYDAASNTATFSPSAVLEPNLVYTATVTTGAKGTTGLPLAANYVWSFTTRARPMIVSTLPASGATLVPTNDSAFVTFSQPMDAATLTTSTFTVMQGTTAIAGVVTWNALTNAATFNPSAQLAPNAVYTATITTGAKDPAGVGLAASYTWSFTTALTPAQPRVVFTTPADDATERALGTRPTATFSGVMAAATINATTFTLRQGATSVPAGVSYDVATNTAVLSPSAALAPGLVYTATVSTAAQDSSGLALAADYSWTFTTSMRPVVASTLPAPGASAVPPNDSVFATFSKAMDAATLTPQTFTLTQGATNVPGVVSLNPATNTATFNPTVTLSANLLYTATLTTGVTDSGGVALGSAYSWTFTTALAPVAPRVALTTPLTGANNVAVSARPTATFSGAMDAATLNATTFTVKQGATPISGLVSYDAATNTATFSPTLSLSPGLVYTATVTTGAKDASGLALAADYAWDFTTAVRPTVVSTLPATGASAVPPNSSVFVTFSKAMDTATLNTQTFTLAQGATAVAGAVTLDAATNTATFNPTAALSANSPYTATLTTGVRDAGGVALAQPYSWTFTTALAPLPPTVAFTTPLNAATNVAVSVNLTATFSQAMDASTITGATFSVKQGANSVPGVVTYNAMTNTTTFNPTATLGNALPYTGTVTTGAKDTAGLALAADYVWTFTTVQGAPTVSGNVPLANALGVSTDASLSATFSRPMSPATINALTFKLTRAGVPAPVLGAVTYDGLTQTATLDPASALVPNTLYTATVSTGAQDATGIALAADFVWTFTTQAMPATVMSVTPLANAVGVQITAHPSATFSQSMDALTLTDSTFTLKQGLNAVAGTVGYDVPTNTATFTPSAPLGLNTLYTATITTGAHTQSGSALGADYVWSFTTAACSQSPVVLGSAANFAVLAGSTVTSTSTVLSPTVVNGDLGVSPGSAVTGFPPGMVIGMIHAGTTTSATAIADLTTAYNSAAGRVLCPVSVAGNLGGMTLAPGLYKSTSSLAISSGNLTLDAQGDGNAIFIFQMASTLTTTDDGRKVILTNGAKAANIFWQVGTSATIGVGSVFHGTIMADQAITLKTGASLTGRALARIAAVSLDTNSVVKPAP
ncbi:MAG: hypothetical protein JWN04_1808 [Myxococcaceae bacterium]|nr:hypothetical protein [Myxococcaceae bacterium]